MRTIRGQSTVEYVVVVAVVIAALLATTVYMKRGKMGDLGRATGQVGAQFNPHQLASKFATESASTRQELQVTSGARASIIVPDTTETQSRVGAERLTQTRVGCEQLFFQDPTGDPVDTRNCPAPADIPEAPKPGDSPIPQVD